MRILAPQINVGVVMFIYIKRKIKNFSYTRTAYLLILFVFIIFRLNRIDPVLSQGLGFMRRNLINIYWWIGYNYHFSGLNLVKAYEFRVYHVLAVWSGVLKGDSVAAERYLSVVSESDFIEMLDIPKHLKSQVKKITNSKEGALNNVKKERKKLCRVVMCGPASNPYEINFDGYDYAVFNKPPPEGIGIEGRKIILILNNAWVIHRRDELIEWLKCHQPAYVISPQNIDFEGVIYNKHSSLPKFLFGASLMGLQRNLFILQRLYNIECLEITGFNFSLSNEPYNKWYPSLTKYNHGDFYKRIVISNSVHDLVLNLTFTRKILQGSDEIANGEIHDICNRRIEKNLELFKSIYSSNGVI